MTTLEGKIHMRYLELVSQTNMTLAVWKDYTADIFVPYSCGHIEIIDVLADRLHVLHTHPRGMHLDRRRVP